MSVSTTTSNTRQFRISYGGAGHGWFVVGQYLEAGRWVERVVAGPYTSKQAAAERAAAELILSFPRHSDVSVTAIELEGGEAAAS